MAHWRAAFGALLLGLAASAQTQIAPIDDTTAPIDDTTAPIDDTTARNVELREELVRLSDETLDAVALNEGIGRDIAQLKVSLRNTDERLAIVGLSGSVAQLLLTERKRLGSPKDQLDTLSELQRDLAQAKLKRIDFREERSALSSPRSAAKALSPDPAVWPALSALLVQRKALLPKLQAAQDKQIDALSSAETSLRERIQLSATLKNLLDERLLWTPSDEALNADFLRAWVPAWREFWSKQRWGTTATLALNRLLHAPLLLLLGLLVLFAFERLRKRALRTLDTLHESATRVRQVDFKPTLSAFAFSIIAALKWPVALALLAFLLKSSGDDGRFSDSLGRALLKVAVVYAPISIMAWMLRERGVAHAHFRWTQKRRQALRRCLLPLTLALLPMVFFTELNAARGLSLEVDPVARVVFILGALALAWVGFAALKPDGIGVRRGHAGEAFPLLRKILRTLLSASMLGLAGLSIYGYHLSALALAQRWLSSSVAILAIVLIHGLVSRWLVLNERRMLLQHRELRRAAGEAGSAEPAEPEIAIEHMGDQTRRLLRAVTLTILALVLFGIWADLLPALKVLDTVTLWQSSTLIAGKSVAAAVTLKSLLLAALALTLMMVALNNLGGLLELALNRVKLAAPTRYAILSIARYLVVVIGLGLALGWLGLRWGQFQWLAAAFTVGLGFGLQEIFANFVSGLILLFERPFRVGDTITVGAYSGTVTRIRTRATTLLDWDNKETVIPNKTFITGQLTNWTLTDNVTRVSIKLHLAHGSNPAQVHVLLREIAQAHPLVLKDPPPGSWLMNLGERAMEFDLKFFVGALRDRLVALNDVNEAISTRLESAGIQLAEPPAAVPPKALPA